MDKEENEIKVNPEFVARELNSIARHNHDLAIKIVMILNPLFTISDYFTVPHLWKQFFFIRLVATAIFISVFVLQDKLRLNTVWVVFIAYMACIFENLIMFSMLEAEALQKFSFAFMATFIGAGMMALWTIRYSLLSMAITLVSGTILFVTLSPLKLNEFMANGAFLTLMVGLFTILLIHTRYTLTYRELVARFKLIEASKKIAEQNRNITDSINYAKRIQEALLTPRETVTNLLPQHFILYRPKDIVSGDFYLVTKIIQQAPDDKQSSSRELILAAVADCTGHGVPGAFMSMLGISSIQEIVQQYESTNKNFTADAILNDLRSKIKKSLRQTGKPGEPKDGMDIALALIDNLEHKIYFAGANNPLVLIREGLLYEYKPDKMPIGIHQEEKEGFTNQAIHAKPNDMVYLFSDGYEDQFGGENGRKFLVKRLKELLISISSLPMTEQKEKLESALSQWQGTYEQVDDITILGFKI